MAKAVSGDASALPPEAVLMMATVCGARAQGREKECGMLKTGMDAEVYDYVFSFPQTEGYMKRLRELLAYTLPLYAEEGKTVLVIAVGCTGGHHRSVAVTRALAEYIRGLGYQVSENHRDMTRS